MTNLAKARIPFSSMFPSSQNACWQHNITTMTILSNLLNGKVTGFVSTEASNQTLMVNSRVANLIATWEDLEMRVPYGRGGSFESVAYQKYSTAYQVAASYP